jgi:hypothetical protein
MKYLARGMGAVTPFYQIVREGDSIFVSPGCLKYQEHWIEAANREDALCRAYEACGDGFWLPNGSYCYFDGEPEILDPPTDQLLLALGASCLPGFEELLCQKS